MREGSFPPPTTPATATRQENQNAQDTKKTPQGSCVSGLVEPHRTTSAETFLGSRLGT